jgi:hypothetical protein
MHLQTIVKPEHC